MCGTTTCMGWCTLRPRACVLCACSGPPLVVRYSEILQKAPKRARSTRHADGSLGARASAATTALDTHRCQPRHVESNRLCESQSWVHPRAQPNACRIDGRTHLSVVALSAPALSKRSTTSAWPSDHERDKPSGKPTPARQTLTGCLVQRRPAIVRIARGHIGAGGEQQRDDAIVPTARGCDLTIHRAALYHSGHRTCTTRGATPSHPWRPRQHAHRERARIARPPHDRCEAR